MSNRIKNKGYLKLVQNKRALVRQKVKGIRFLWSQYKSNIKSKEYVDNGILKLLHSANVMSQVLRLLPNDHVQLLSLAEEKVDIALWLMLFKIKSDSVSIPLTWIDDDFKQLVLNAESQLYQAKIIKLFRGVLAAITDEKFKEIFHLPQLERFLETIKKTNVSDESEQEKHELIEKLAKIIREKELFEKTEVVPGNVPEGESDLSKLLIHPQINRISESSFQPESSPQMLRHEEEQEDEEWTLVEDENDDDYKEKQDAFVGIIAERLRIDRTLPNGAQRSFARPIPGSQGAFNGDEVGDSFDTESFNSTKGTCSSSGTFASTLSSHGSLSSEGSGEDVQFGMSIR